MASWIQERIEDRHTDGRLFVEILEEFFPDRRVDDLVAVGEERTRELKQRAPRGEVHPTANFAVPDDICTGEIVDLSGEEIGPRRDRLIW